MIWSGRGQQAIDNIKNVVTSTSVLRFFDTNIPAIIQTNASSTGLGTVLLQNNQPVSYVSRALTDVETRYAQMEKELIAIVFTVEKFEYYIHRRQNGTLQYASLDFR